MGGELVVQWSISASVVPCISYFYLTTLQDDKGPLGWDATTIEPDGLAKLADGTKARCTVTAAGGLTTYELATGVTISSSRRYLLELSSYYPDSQGQPQQSDKWPGCCTQVKL